MTSSDKQHTIRGHCSCGSLRYTIDISNIDKDLQLSAYCHCSSCQRLNGAPFVWTSHWLYPAVTWDPPALGPPPSDPNANDSSSSPGHFSPNMDTFESMKGRKWKLRCKQCGSPLGSWNAVRSKWTIWPVTLERTKAPGSDKEGNKAEGDFNVPPDVMAQITPDHHQFYGAWKAMDIDDGREKWTGYKGESTQVDV